MTMIRSILTFSSLAPVSVSMTKNMNHVTAGPSQGKKKATTKAIRAFFSSVLNTHRKLPKLRESKCPPFIYAHQQRVRKHKQHESKCKILKESRFRNRFKLYTRK